MHKMPNARPLTDIRAFIYICAFMHQDAWKTRVLLHLVSRAHASDLASRCDDRMHVATRRNWQTAEFRYHFYRRTNVIDAVAATIENSFVGTRMKVSKAIRKFYLFAVHGD